MVFQIVPIDIEFEVVIDVDELVGDRVLDMALASHIVGAEKNSQVLVVSTGTESITRLALDFVDVNLAANLFDVFLHEAHDGTYQT